MAKRKASNSSKKELAGYAFTPSYRESRVKRREVTSTALEEAGAGLLQLRLGRAAQAHGLGAAFCLAFSAFLIYSASTAGTLLQFPENYLHALLWLMPLFVGATVSADALARKWVPYRGYRHSRHFVLTGLALGLSILGMIAIIFTLIPLLGLGLLELKWLMYPLSVSTLSLGLISMADTWRGWGPRKVVSIVSALALPGIMVLWSYLNLGALLNADPSVTGAEQARLLAMFFYFIMALAALLSGSELHIIASSTSTAEREILFASDAKFSKVQKLLSERERALAFRQTGLDEKEAIIEADRRELEEELQKIGVSSTEHQNLQAQLEKRDKELRDYEKRVSRVRAEIEARIEQIKLKESDVSVAEAGLEKARQDLASRESARSERDKELKRIAIELTAAQRQSEARVKAVQELEQKLKHEDATLSARQKQLLQKDKTIQLRESEVNLRMEQLEAMAATKDAERIRELKDWERRILEKEKELGQLEVELKTLEDQLKERYENATSIEKRASGDRRHLEAKEKELLTREKRVSDAEAALEEVKSELERTRTTMRESAGRIQKKEAEYVTLLKDTKVQQATATSSQDELGRRQAALDARQKKIDEMHENLKREIERLSAENRRILQQKKEVETREQEVSLQALEFEEKARATRAIGATPGMKDTDKESYLAQWEERLREKEEEIRRLKYQADKEVEAKEKALRAQVQAGVSEAAQEVVIEEKKARVKTGTPRLDDLLYGGIPFNANVLAVGPAFVGKEVLILNFIAEGLKKGIPAIIVTTARPPTEIAKEMAPILPTLVEYEQLGLVYWVDSSAPTGASGKPVRDKNTWRVNGPSDFESIMKIFNELDGNFRGKYPYFRVAFLSLSSCIALPDQNAGLGFVQQLVNRLRQTKAVAMYALERGMHTDQQVESLEHLMDGAIYFKSEKQKTTIQIVGLSEVQTREWVPYKHSNKALSLGAFQLERIR